jgi:hypothetical protein
MRTFARRLIASTALATLGGCSNSYGPEDFYSIWGGEGVQLLISETRARFETSCWAGELAIPVQIDGDDLHASGNVNWVGGAGGTETRAVTLHGRIDGNEMQLTVESSANLGPYTLRRNREASIPGCP